MKFEIDENVMNHSQLAANHLMPLNIIGFDMPKRQFNYANDKLLPTQFEHFAVQALLFF